MPRRPDSGQIDLAEVFRRVQEEMLAQLSVGRLFEHASSAGAATEHHWLQLFDRYLPKRYRAAPAFVIDSTGRRSRQIDIAIFDNLYTPPLFPHSSGLHLPAESVYAVFEVKPTFSRQWLRDAAEKAASVRSLRRTSVSVIGREAMRPPAILAGLLHLRQSRSADPVPPLFLAPPTRRERLRRLRGQADLLPPMAPRRRRKSRLGPIPPPHFRVRHRPRSNAPARNISRTPRHHIR